MATAQRGYGARMNEPQGVQVPSPSNPQQPAGVVPPGGPLKSTGEIAADRDAAERAAAVEEPEVDEVDDGSSDTA